MKWWIEGFSKVFLFASLWYLTPELLRIDRIHKLNRIAGRALRFVFRTMSLLAAIYLLGIIAAGIDHLLPKEWKFIDKQPVSQNEDHEVEYLIVRNASRELPPSGTPQALELTKSNLLTPSQKPSLYRRLVQGVLAIAAILLLRGVYGMMNSPDLPKPPPQVNQEPIPIVAELSAEEKVRRRYMWIGAGLFSIGSTLDMLKWWIDR